MRWGAWGLLWALGVEAHAGGVADGVIGYDEGLVVKSLDERWLVHVEWRIQTRLTVESREGPGTPVVFGVEPRRAQARIGGHLGWKWMAFYNEWDLVGLRLNDLRVMPEPIEGLETTIGQAKVPYGREQSASSREQQFAERSLANSWFTLERQIGLHVGGDLFPNTHGHFGIVGGVYFGDGRNEIGRDPYPLVLARVQWHPARTVVDKTMSDLDFTPKPAVTLTLGGAWVRGPYTEFSSSGGRQLPGYEAGERDRYVLQQGLFDAATRWRGFSAQGEWNLKRIVDTERDDATLLTGGYAQVGWLPHGVFASIPENYEVAVRFVLVDPNTLASDDQETELTLAFNAYIEEHRNKVTLDGSRLTIAGTPEYRLRLQWDFSF